VVGSRQARPDHRLPAELPTGGGRASDAAAPRRLFRAWFDGAVEQGVREPGALALPTADVAGLGGGAVISPNVTLTLEYVPPWMGGVAAGAMQTGQRIGSAIGTSVLVAVFYGVLFQGAHYQNAIAVALLTATGFVCLALLVAVQELRARRRRAAPCGG
jgi:hypothetical protein